MAAESICGRKAKFRGVQGTSVCAAFGLTIASTGASEKFLKRCGVTDYQKVYLHPGHHVRLTSEHTHDTIHSTL